MRFGAKGTLPGSGYSLECRFRVTGIHFIKANPAFEVLIIVLRDSLWHEFSVKMAQLKSAMCRWVFFNGKRCSESVIIRISGVAQGCKSFAKSTRTGKQIYDRVD